MLAFSPPLFPTFGWALEDPINHDQHNNIYPGTETLDSLFHFPLPQPQVEHEKSSNSDPTKGDHPITTKKITHNASERDRRKKINSLFSSLRSLLPTSDQTKKLSIPNMVGQVLKYVPELKKEVEKLGRRKEELLSMISKQGHLIHCENEKQEQRILNSLYTVSVSLMGDERTEAMVQISTVKGKNNLLLNAIEALEEEGICVINGSYFQSFGGRIFYNLHLQVQGPQRKEIEMLREKLTSLCETNSLNL